MAQPAGSLRRSGRRRTHNARYSDDAFAKLKELDILSDEEQAKSLIAEDSLSEEFDPDQAIDLVEDDDQISSPEGAREDGGSDDDRDADDGFPVAVDISPTKRRAVPAKAMASRGRRRKQDLQPDTGVHARGVQSDRHVLTSDYRMLHTFGPSEHDRSPIIKATEKWYDQTTKLLRKPDRNGVGGFRYSFFSPEAGDISTASSGWLWYYEKQGRSVFDRRTTTKKLKEEIAMPYVFHKKVDRELLWGPRGRQSPFKLGPHRSIDLEIAWTEACTANKIDQGRKTTRSPYRGWGLNICDTVHHVEWLPHQTGNFQYLALATWPRDLADGTSAFTPSGAIAASIQIWEFQSSLISTDSLTFDNRHEPRLALALCFDWGLVKEFKWCPAKRSPPSKEGNKLGSLGLLAIIHSDGNLRVFDVKFSGSKSKDTEYRHYSSSAFESCPPDTVCSCVTWISSSLIAAGCANGYVAIWDISSHLLQPEPDAEPSPILYQSFHMTFIRSIVSCQPSRPHLLVTSAMDGILRLTDIHSPKMDFVYSTRSRTGFPAIAWHEQTQHILSGEETYNLKCFNLRMFFRLNVLATFDACPLSIATSPVHPFALVGTTDGAVSILNPLRRLVASKRVAGGDFARKWFKHEWRRGKPLPQSSDRADQANDAGDSTAQGRPLDFPNGLIRLTSEFPERPVAAHTNEGNTRRAASGSIHFSTVFEEETGVRCTAWNPNLACGGWAAAGMGSGIVIVEDLAVDR